MQGSFVAHYCFNEAHKRSRGVIIASLGIRPRWRIVAMNAADIFTAALEQSL
jgi:hypothetical protein